MSFTLYTFVTGVLNAVESAVRHAVNQPLPPSPKSDLSCLVPSIVENCKDIFYKALQEAAKNLNFTPPDKDKDLAFQAKVSEIKSVITTSLEDPQTLTTARRDFWINYNFFGLKGQISRVGVQIKFGMKADVADEKFLIQVKLIQTILMVEQDYFS